MTMATIFIEGVLRAVLSTLAMGCVIQLSQLP
jgi:hypothetical protein